MNETLADILRDMRNCQLASVTKVEKFNRDKCFGCDSHPACAEVAEFADRIEAAMARSARNCDRFTSGPEAVGAYHRLFSEAELFEIRKEARDGK